LKINSAEDFHDYEFSHAIELYNRSVKAPAELGTALAVCANFREAHYFKNYPFTEVLLTGHGDREEEVRKAADGAPRISYREENCEALPFPSRSFDLVFCKEGLHHLPRPVLGLYEMLRVCRRAVVFVEPYDSFMGRCFEGMGWATLFEGTNVGNPDCRRNYVFRWNRRLLESVLHSYYLDSGFRLEMHVGWLSKRANAHSSPIIRTFAAWAGWAASLLPPTRGNVLTAMIVPGSDIPPDPAQFSARH
jgi:SAM-dependent methyltransferase